MRIYIAARKVAAEVGKEAANQLRRSKPTMKELEQ
jgi:hypothetical protein